MVLTESRSALQTTERLRISLREPTTVERAAWEKYIDSHARYTARWHPKRRETLAGCILSLVIIVGALTWFVWHKWGFFWGLTVAVLGAAITSVQPSVFRNRARQRDAAIAELDQMRTSFAGNVVEVVDVSPLGLVVGEEWSDLGDNFFFDVGSRTILCLNGQWCYGGGVDQAFLLRQQFTLVRSPGDWYPFHASSCGEELKPMRTIPADTISRLPMEGSIFTFTGSLDTLEDDLLTHQVARPART